MQKVLITGITGQDGSYLAEEYLAKGWEVHGIVRRTSTLARPRIDHLFSENVFPNQRMLKLHYGDLNDFSAVIRIIDKVQPTHVVNLGAQSHVAISFEVPIETSLVTGIGAGALIEAVRIVNRDIHIYQASSSEMFGGGAGPTILNEDSPFDPKSPYGIAKLYAYYMAKIYRESYGMHISNGILFNHESPKRGENFVSRKISKGVAQIKKGIQKKLYLGNLEATRDWGHAQDYMRAVKMMLEADEPGDYVVATGISHSVREFAETAFSLVGLHYGDYVEIDPSLFRPNEVHDLMGDSSKIYERLGWAPEINFEQLVKEMVDHDMKDLGN